MNIIFNGNERELGEFAEYFSLLPFKITKFKITKGSKHS